MYEEIRFTPEETGLMKSMDVMAAEWAFGELTKKAFRDRELYRFKPKSIEDYRFIEAGARYKLMDACIKEVRSPRFSQERKNHLKELKAFIEKLSPEVYSYCYELMVIESRCLNKNEWPSKNWSNCLDALQNTPKTEYTTRLLQISKIISREQRIHIGYLNLIHRLIQIGDRGDPVDLIPPEALYYAWPSPGTIVVAWNKANPEQKTIGMIHGQVDFYDARVDPLERRQDDSLGLGASFARETFWADSVLPLSLIEFYLNKPRLFFKHRQILATPELDFISELMIKRGVVKNGSLA